MKLDKIQDLRDLPSVLTGEETSRYMIELIEVIKRDHIDVYLAGDAINDLLSYLGECEVLDHDASLAIFKWTKATYDSSDKEIVYKAGCNLSSSNCEEAIAFIEEKVLNPDNEYEYCEFKETADELGIKT